MKQQSTARFPRARSVYLALSLIALVLLAGFPEQVAETGPPLAAAQNQLVWVRQDPPVINSLNDPTFWECPEGVHCEGSFWDYIVDETDMIKEERYVNNGHEYYHITLRSVFDRPPLVMNPGSRYRVRANFTHSKISGVPTYAECLYFQYHDIARPWLTDPPWEVAYCPWADYFDGTASAEWMLDPGWPFKEGDTFEVRAEWLGGAIDSPANVTWTYRAERDTLVEEARLGAEVVAPVVTYQGEEVPPGEMFFPETCSDGRSSEPCEDLIGLLDAGKLDCKCVSAMTERLLTLLQLVDFRKNESEIEIMMAIVYMANIKIAENCRLTRSATGDYELGLVLEQGAILLNNALDGQTVDVITPAGSASTVTVGTFLTAYNPATNTATFQAHGAPLTVRPETGPPLDIQPNQQVVVTGDGAGPVTDLPHLFLPLQIR